MLYVLFVIILAGVALYLVNTYVPMAAPLKTILNIVVVLVICVWLCTVFFGPIASWGPPAPRVR
jgi:hypothetical protein